MLVKRKENKSCSMNFAEVQLIIFEHLEKKEHSEKGLTEIYWSYREMAED